MVGPGAVVHVIVFLSTISFEAKGENVEYLSYKLKMMEESLFKLVQRRSALEQELRVSLETLSRLEQFSVSMEIDDHTGVRMSDVENIRTSLVEEKLRRFLLRQTIEEIEDWYKPEAARERVTEVRNRTLWVVNEVSRMDNASCVCSQEEGRKTKSQKSITTTTPIQTTVPTSAAESTTTTSTTTTTTVAPVTHQTVRHRPGKGVIFSVTPLNDNGDELANDCGDLWEQGFRENGVYRLQLTGKESALVSCKLEETAHNWGVGNRQQRHLRGWMLVQSRWSGIQDFNKTWDEYKHGFGDFSTDFWLGNELLWRFVNKSSVAPLLLLRLYIDGNDNDDDNGDQSSYHKFFINKGLKMYPEEEGYKLFYTSYIHARETKYQGPGRGVFRTWDRQSEWSGCPAVNSGWWYSQSRCDKMRQTPHSKYTFVGRKPVLGYEYIYRNSRTKKDETIIVIGSELLVYVRIE